MESLIQDLKFSLKVLWKRPVFTIAAVVTLALGIGANSAVFSVIHGVLLSPLPYPQSEQLVMLWQSLPEAGVDEAPVSPLNFTDWREQNQVFEEMAAFSVASFTLQGTGDPRSVRAGWVTPGFFQVLGIQASQGRVLRASAEEAGAANEVVVSYPLWQSRFGSDPGLVGKTIQLDDKSYEVVGVAPPGFEFLIDADLWVPRVFQPQELLERMDLSQLVVARVRDGVSVQQARSNMEGIAQRMAADFGMQGQWGIRVIPLRDYVVGDVGGSLWVLFGVVAFVLLVACTNVASLLLARAAEREKEFAMRQALGAGRWRLVRQTLTESIVLALVGGVSGLLLAAASIAALKSLRPAGIPRIDEIQMDPVVLVFTLLVAVATGLIFGLLPALQTPNAKLSEVMKEGMGSGGGGLKNLRSAFVIVEIALALVLLIGAGLTVRSFQQLQKVDPGFRPAGTLTADIALPDGSYPSGPQQLNFFDRLKQEMERIPKVQDVAYITSLPLSGREEQQGVIIEGRPPTPGVPDGAGMDSVSPGYFQAMGIDLKAGRTFGPQDRADSLPVLIVNEAFARHYFPGDEALGKRVMVPGVSEEYREIVGVVADIKRYGLQAEAREEVYVPYAQHSFDRQVSFVLRTEAGADPLGLTDELRQAVWAVDGTQAIAGITTMAERFADSTSQRRFNTLLISLAAGLALVLAVLGIHGVLAYFVSQRRREIGLRVALGAQQQDVLTLILKRGLELAGVGVAIGVVAAFFLTRFMSSVLYGIDATDPLTFFGVALLFLLAAAIASLLPARRAARLDPLVALRTE
ncbi:MAG: ABC transporter permease [Acidobacteriota bacterium]|nr:ABC transporter permease [Acidobacteriota bacterium]